MVDFNDAKAKEEALNRVRANLDPSAEEFVEIPGEEMPEFGEFVKLDNLGDSISGIYERARQLRGGFGEQTVYDLRTQEGLFTLPGNFDLDSKMTKVRKNAFVRITFIDEREMNRADFSAMKIYRVEVSRKQQGEVKNSPVRNIGTGKQA